MDYKPKLLLLEDDATLTYELGQALEAENFDVSVCRNAMEGIFLCQERTFEIAIVDIFVVNDDQFIPDGGLTFLSRLRNNRELRLKTRSDIPVIAISGAASIKQKNSPLEMAMTLGATATLPKPFAPAELINEIRRVMPQT